MVDEAHGAGVLGARGAGSRGAARRRGPRRPAHGHVLQVAGLLRRLHRRAGRRHRVPARSSRAPSCSPPRPCRRPSGAALAALRDRALRRGPRAAGRACSTTRAAGATGCVERGFQVVSLALPTAATSSRRSSPSSSSDDWKAVAALEGALRRRASSSTPRCTRPCRPAARCCARASWPPTTAPTLDRALDAFAAVKTALRGRARPAAGSRRRADRSGPTRRLEPVPRRRAARPNTHVAGNPCSLRVLPPFTR